MTTFKLTRFEQFGQIYQKRKHFVAIKVIKFVVKFSFKFEAS